MGYVPGFEWDIFINYPMEAEDWARQFEADLKKELALFLSRKVEIYFAKRNWELGLNSNVMLEQARKSCLFVAVLTRGSVAQSENRFLTEEWEAFRESGPVIGRFIPLSLKKIASQEILKIMPIGNDGSFHTSSARFFVEEDGVEFTLRPDANPTRAALYHAEVAKVARHIAERLDDIRLQPPKTPRVFDVTGAYSSTTVFLARIEPNSSVRTEWTDIRALLINDGATVVPDETENDFAAMASAHLFVQLFNPLDNLSIAKAQLKLAEARRIPILQWLKKLPNPKQPCWFWTAWTRTTRHFAKVPTPDCSNSSRRRSEKS